MKIGQGYDIHRLIEGKKLTLGGVTIPYEKGLYGHSDADVLTHAIIDAILGAACLGDIGKYFPDNDMKWKDANSIDLLKVALEHVKNLGLKIVNIDSTIIAEEPKLSPYIDKMRESLSKALEININQINIKAKTNEGQDSIGQKQSICAHAIVLLS